MIYFDNLVVVRGGGDIATGAVQKFHRAGFPVLILETKQPTAIRRGAALCEAVYSGFAQVEDVSCRMISDLTKLQKSLKANEVPILIDPKGESIGKLNPCAVVDAIMAKRNLGTHMNLADVTIALGPGFCAGKDVHAVIETMRGHDLGRLIFDGYAMPDTGIPGEVEGKSSERVIRAPVDGVVECRKQIGDVVAEGEIILTVDGVAAYAPFSGLLRGIIREGMLVRNGMKLADIDLRTDIDCKTISDKSRCIGGAALEAYLYLRQG